MDHEPFHERKINFYYIKEFVKQGYNVEYWALCDVLPYMKAAKFQYRFEKDYVKYISSIDDLYAKLEMLDPKRDLLIVEFWFLFSTRNIFKKISRKGIKWVRIDYYLNPTKSIIAAPSFADKLKDLNMASIFKKVVNWSFNKTFRDQYAIPHMLFVTGQSHEYVSKAHKVISLDYFDILEYDSKKNTNSLVNFPYIVYLDIMVLDHPDIAMLGKKNIISKSAYYDAINNVFQKVEQCTGLPIVIAAHPKAAYKDEFGDRLIFANKTAELVIHSNMVLTHGSLAISYALLAGKPICYLNLEKFFLQNEFLKSIYRSMLRAKEQLNATVVSEDITCESLKGKVDAEKYKRYLINYFCKQERNIPNFTIINNGILELMDEN